MILPYSLISSDMFNFELECTSADEEADPPVQPHALQNLPKPRDEVPQGGLSQEHGHHLQQAA
jgi:hypothetical protein